MRLVTVAHGTRRAEGNATARELTALAGRRVGIPATASYVELAEPLLEDVVGRPEGPAVVVPLLLSTGYHVRVDLPRACRAGDARLGRPLGPDPLLTAAQVDRLQEAGAAPGTPVVLVAAGSTDPEALLDLCEATRLLAEAWGVEARLATLGGLGERPADVLRRGDVVAPYLLSPGLFSRRVQAEARAGGALACGDVLGVHPAVVDLVVRRARDLLADRSGVGSEVGAGLGGDVHRG